jgi:predicted GNAT family N-acyltransferase
MAERNLMSDTFHMRPATSPEDILKVMVVRGIVFVEEQQVAYDDEIDEYESETWHFLGELDGEPMAAGRLRQVPDGPMKVERVAVRAAWRGKGYGKEVVDHLIAAATAKGVGRLAMHAQVHLRDFYANFGFVAQGEVFDECGIDHVLMVREGD